MTTRIIRGQIKASKPKIIAISSELDNLNKKLIDDRDLSEQDMKRLLFDPPSHQEFIKNSEENLENLRHLLDVNFITMTFGDAQTVPYDTEAEKEARIANKNKFERYVRRAKAEGKKVPANPRGKEAEGYQLAAGRSHYFRQVSNDEDLRENFHEYLKEQQAKGKVHLLKPKTVNLYLSHVFGPKLGCFKDWCKQRYGKDFQLHQFMFTPVGEFTTMNPEMIIKVATIQAPYGSAHTSLLTSGVVWLLRFFGDAARAVHIPRMEHIIRTDQNTFTEQTRDLEGKLSKKLAGIREQSEREANANKNRKKILNPEEEGKKREACNK